MPLTQDQYQSFAMNHTSVPIFRSIPVGRHTPMTVMAQLRETSAKTALLEYIPAGKEVERYSYVCINPVATVRQSGDLVTVDSGDGPYTVAMTFVDLLRKMASDYNPPRLDSLPPFTGGWVGYLGYETATWREKVPIHAISGDDPPDALFMLFDTVLAYDHDKGEIVILHSPLIDTNIPVVEQFRSGMQTVDNLANLLQVDYVPTAQISSESYDETFNMSADQFHSAVIRAKQHIVEGDVFQVVLSIRFERKTDASPHAIYAALREINPSPYMFHLQIDDFGIIGASPEALLKVTDRHMHMRPIAGTHPRGKTPAEDEELANKLLSDEKERAEHVMLVDLARNDIGRVAEYDTVNVSELMSVEYYSHVMHLVSKVEGRLRDEFDGFDALDASFPAGTLTGTPKIRAMEIINELEADRRGLYSGTIGYLDFYGNLDACVAIRFLTLTDGVARYQSGAGIVADSVPEKEFAESVAKSRAVVKAISLAESGSL